MSTNKTEIIGYLGLVYDKDSSKLRTMCATHYIYAGPRDYEAQDYNAILRDCIEDNIQLMTKEQAVKWMYHLPNSGVCTRKVVAIGYYNNQFHVLSEYYNFKPEEKFNFYG